MRRQRSVIDVAGKKSKKSTNVKHGTRPYQKDEGGPSWDRNQEKPPNNEEMMVLIDGRPDDLELYRTIFSKLSMDPEMQSLSMTELMDMAIMTMLQAKITNWMLEVDSPERMEAMSETNKMWRSIIQIKSKTMRDARERAPVGGTFEGISQVLDEVEEDDEGENDEVDTDSA